MENDEIEDDYFSNVSKHRIDRILEESSPEKVRLVARLLKEYNHALAKVTCAYLGGPNGTDFGVTELLYEVYEYLRKAKDKGIDFENWLTHEDALLEDCLVHLDDGLNAWNKVLDEDPEMKEVLNKE